MIYTLLTINNYSHLVSCSDYCIASWYKNYLAVQVKVDERVRVCSHVAGDRAMWVVDCQFNCCCKREHLVMLCKHRAVAYTCVEFSGVCNVGSLSSHSWQSCWRGEWGRGRARVRERGERESEKKKKKKKGGRVTKPWLDLSTDVTLFLSLPCVLFHHVSHSQNTSFFY